MGRLEQPRVAWLMIPAGEPTEMAFQTLLLPLMEEGDVLVDGGNSNFRDSIRRAERRGQGVCLLDAGVSGGIWGLAEGYCLMVGGEAPAFETAEPALATLAPEGGLRARRAVRRGPLREDGAQRDRVRPMQAYAEGSSP